MRDRTVEPDQLDLSPIGSHEVADYPNRSVDTVRVSLVGFCCGCFGFGTEQRQRLVDRSIGPLANSGFIGSAKWVRHFENPNVGGIKPSRNLFGKQAEL